MKVFILNKEELVNEFDSRNDYRYYDSDEIAESLQKEVLSSFDICHIDTNVFINYRKSDFTADCIFKLVSYFEGVFIYEYTGTIS